MLLLDPTDLHITWHPEERQFVVRSKVRAWDHLLQALPGARMDFRHGGFTVPEISVVDLTLLSGGHIPSGYLQHLVEMGAPASDSVILPSTLAGCPLYTYQRHDAARMYGRSWALWNDPGTGKTRTMAAALHAMLRDGLTRGMVWIQPLQTIEQVRHELAEHWHITSASAEKWDGETVLLINPDKLAVKWRYADTVITHIRRNNAILCVDESQRVARANQASAQLMRWRFIAQYRWAASGTPMQNGIDTYYRPYVFVTGANCSESAWDKKFIKAADGSAKNLTQLHTITRTFACRRTKSDPEVAANLPSLQIEIRWVALEGRQAALYNEIAQRLSVEIQGANDETWNLFVQDPFVKMMRLFHVCRDPHALLGESLPPKRNAKVQALADLIQELQGHKKVIWSGHPRILDRVVHDYGGVAYHGEVPQNQRGAIKAQFISDPTCEIFAANPSVAGTGLDGLQYASSIGVVLDLPNQAPVWKQMVDRQHRNGQTKSVTIYVVLAKNTIEEWQWGHIQKKIQWAEAILDGHTKGQMPPISKSELLRALHCR